MKNNKKKNTKKCEREYSFYAYAVITYATFVASFLATIEVIHVLEHLGLTDLYSILF